MVKNGVNYATRIYIYDFTGFNLSKINTDTRTN